MDPETSSYINKAQLDYDEVHTFFNPPCKLHLQLGEFISPNPNNVDSINIRKSPNSFFLYRKNYIAKHKSPRNQKDGKALSKRASVSWKNESDKVKGYFKVLAKVALQKHKIAYENRKNHIFIPQQPGPQQKQIDDNNNDSVVSSSHYPHSFAFLSTCHYTNDNTTSSYQQLELQQNQKDNLHNNDCAVSSSSNQYYSISSYTSDNITSELQKDNFHKNNDTDCAFSLSSCQYSSITSYKCFKTQQKNNLHQKNNNNYAVSSSSYQCSTFSCTTSSSSPHPYSYTSYNTSSSHFMTQLQLQQKDNFYKNNNSDDTVSSPSPYSHSPSYSSSCFMAKQLEPQQKYNFYFVRL
ncbi:17_t:CDS:2 [Entrophospora sp. SA101]|nr:2289_t:CDS:2 [Entrophospora sp. SA101]CAJ0896734.1 17_t:CDS:2 [Entrophospora sp. SA101]